MPLSLCAGMVQIGFSIGLRAALVDCSGLMLRPWAHRRHWGRPNSTRNQVRLSLDARVQPLSAPRSWQTETSLEELRGFRADCQALLEERGVVGKEFELMITGGYS